MATTSCYSYPEILSWILARAGLRIRGDKHKITVVAGMTGFTFVEVDDGEGVRGGTVFLVLRVGTIEDGMVCRRHDAIFHGSEGPKRLRIHEFFKVPH
jgi:hypothetical protein